MLELALRERGGPIAIAPDEWRRLRLEATVGALARNGILRIERTSAAILLFPSHYVGGMRAPGVSLTIAPKDDALHRAMLGLALGFEGRQSYHYEGSGSHAEGDDIASFFVGALARCVDEGLPWHYQHEVEATSRPRGKPEFARTISDFVSRGVMHKVVAHRHERQQSAPFANVVWAAYRCLSSAPGVTAQLLRRTALLMESFDAPGEFSVAAAIDLAERLLVDGEDHSQTEKDLLAASLALLDRNDRIGTALLPVSAGVARFNDLERIWERAVARLVSAIGGAGTIAKIHGLAGDKLRLFVTGGPSINPDVIVFAREGNIELIADAKYKIMSDREQEGIASDVYQLTCYLERTEAPLGLLVYVGTSDSVLELGTTRHGARALTVRISAERLVSDGEHALVQLLTANKPALEAI